MAQQGLAGGEQGVEVGRGRHHRVALHLVLAHPGGFVGADARLEDGFTPRAAQARAEQRVAGVARAGRTRGGLGPRHEPAAFALEGVARQRDQAALHVAAPIDLGAREVERGHRLQRLLFVGAAFAQ